MKVQAMTILVTRPQHDDATFYLSKWIESIFDLAKQKGHSLIDLNKERSNPKDVTAILEKKKPKLVLFNGHGDPQTITGHNNQPLIQSNHNEHLLKGTITYAIACDCAAKLGPDSVKKGCHAFIGYQASFIFVFDPSRSANPLSDSFAAPVFEASNEIASSLIKGNTVQEAFEKSQATFDKWIVKLQKSDAPPEAQHILATLYWDKSVQTFHGNEEASIN